MSIPKVKNPNVAYLKTLVKRIEEGIKAIEKAELPRDVTEQERKIRPVLNELQMVAPRVWDDVSKASLKRRKDIQDEM